MKLNPKLSSLSSNGDTKPLTQPPTGTRVSIFGIIVMGLIGGLIVGLLVNSTFTLEGFFLGFAGGALITVGAYLFATMKSSPTK